MLPRIMSFHIIRRFQIVAFNQLFAKNAQFDNISLIELYRLQFKTALEFSETRFGKTTKRHFDKTIVFLLNEIIQINSLFANNIKYSGFIATHVEFISQILKRLVINLLDMHMTSHAYTQYASLMHKLHMTALRLHNYCVLYSLSDKNISSHGVRVDETFNPRLVTVAILQLFKRTLVNKSHLNDICSICLDPMIADVIVKFECSHSFHEQCIKVCLKQDNRCPLCRKNIR